MSFCKISLKIWMKTTKFYLCFTISPSKLFWVTQKILPFKIYFPNLRENNTFFHKICFDILECGNNYLRKGKDRNPWVFANYLEDFCHSLKLKTSLKRGWILICLGSKCIKNGNIKGWFSNDSPPKFYFLHTLTLCNSLITLYKVGFVSSMLNNGSSSICRRNSLHCLETWCFRRSQLWRTLAGMICSSLWWHSKQ